jgi:hypothetical protein
MKNEKKKDKSEYFSICYYYYIIISIIIIYKSTGKATCFPHASEYYLIYADRVILLQDFRGQIACPSLFSKPAWLKALDNGPNPKLTLSNNGPNPKLTLSNNGPSYLLIIQVGGLGRRVGPDAHLLLSLFFSGC